MKCSLRKPVQTQHVAYVVRDLSDAFTWSFPEFLPFCPHLYYFSSFKAYQDHSGC